MAFQLGSVNAKIEADVGGFKKAMSEAEGSVDSLKKKFSRFGDSMKKIGKKWTLFATTPIVGAGVAALKAAADFEQLEVAFETMLGSGEKAQQLLKDLEVFAKGTPFEFTTLTDSTKRLLAYGTAAEDVIPTVEMLGNISSGIGMDKLPQLTLAFGQVQAATKLTGAELRQFSEAGVPLLGTLADNFNVTAAEMIEMISAGEVGFEDVKTALMSMTEEGGKFHNLMQEQSQTTAGQFSNLKDELGFLARDIGTILIPIAVELIQKLRDLVSWFNGLSEEQKKTILVIVGIVAAIGPLLLILGTLVSGVSAVISILGVVGSVIGFIIASPIALLVAAIVALFLAWKTNFLGIQDQVKALWELIKIKFNEGVDFLKKIGHVIIDVITAPFRNAWETVKGIVNGIKDALDFTKRHSPSVVDIVKKGVNEVNKALGGLTYDMNVTPQLAAASVSNSATGPQITNVRIDMNGAIISDEFGAERMGELVGDSIIRKLQANVRF